MHEHDVFILAETETSDDELDEKRYRDWDVKLHREYYKRLCSHLDEITQPAHSPKPPEAIVGYWENAKSTAELVFEHFVSSLQQGANTKLSELHAKHPELYENPDILIAICIEGNQRW